MKWNLFVDLAARVIGALIAALSPEIRELLVKFVNDLDEKAQKTPNPIDDHFTELLKKLLGV